MSKNHADDAAFIVSGSLFVASFVLDMYLSMFPIPFSEMQLLEWVSWILSVGGVIVFVSALINHKYHK